MVKKVNFMLCVFDHNKKEIRDFRKKKMIFLKNRILAAGKE